MGFLNPRAICPNCGAKIHTQKHFAVSTRTGTECPQCGVALTGKVGANNRAKMPGGNTALERLAQQAKAQSRPEKPGRLDAWGAKVEAKAAHQRGLLRIEFRGVEPKKARRISNDATEKLSDEQMETLAQGGNVTILVERRWSSFVMAQIQHRGGEVVSDEPAAEPGPDQAASTSEAHDLASVELLKRLGELRESGVLTDEEFAEKKAAILSTIGNG